MSSGTGAGGRERPGQDIRYADRYQVLYKIGAGGMATVYLADDERLGRQVAIKRLRAESSEDAAERFRREAQLAASLNHPNVVTVYDILSDEDAVLIVMEYVAGSDLGRRLKKRDPIPRERSLAILADVASGLDHAHGHGVVHRDVKPSNVLLGERGEAKLTDLGVAKVLEDTSSTRSGALPGTPLYMAPEQLRGERVSPATDIYSLGLIAFQMLSGKHPRSGGTLPEIAHQAVNRPAPDLREVWEEAPDEVAEVLCRALDRDPAVRPRSAPQLVEQLEGALAGRAAAAPPPTVTMPVQGPAETEEAPGPVATPEPEPIVHEPEPRRGGSPARALLAVCAVAAATVLVLLLFTGGEESAGPGADQGRGAGAAGGGTAVETGTAARPPATARPARGAGGLHRYCRQARGGARVRGDLHRRQHDVDDLPRRARLGCHHHDRHGRDRRPHRARGVHPGARGRRPGGRDLAERVPDRAGVRARRHSRAAHRGQPQPEEDGDVGGAGQAHDDRAAVDRADARAPGGGG
jgi:serine/threonine-protein kinase